MSTRMHKCFYAIYLNLHNLNSSCYQNKTKLNFQSIHNLHTSSMKKVFLGGVSWMMFWLIIDRILQKISEIICVDQRFSKQWTVFTANKLQSRQKLIVYHYFCHYDTGLFLFISIFNTFWNTYYILSSERYSHFKIS